jgi:hypothetical protein
MRPDYQSGNAFLKPMIGLTSFLFLRGFEGESAVSINVHKDLCLIKKDSVFTGLKKIFFGHLVFFVSVTEMLAGSPRFARK